jgi:hypothetical protein
MLSAFASLLRITNQPTPKIATGQLPGAIEANISLTSE